VRLRRILGVAAVGLALSLGATACGGDNLSDDSDSSSSESESKGELVIGSAGFTEINIMAEMYAALLQDAGYETTIQTVQNRELYQPALESGEIDVVPDYAATMTEFLNRKVNGPDAAVVATSDVDTTVTALRELAEPLGLTPLDPAEAVDQNAFVVSEEFATQNNLTTLSDLGASGIEVSLAAGEECATRPFCQPGLEQTYGIKISRIDPLGVATVPTKQSVQEGRNQLGLALTTDGTLEDFGLVVLEDDKGLQLADNLIPIVNTEQAGAEDIATALNQLAEVLTTEDLAELNRRVDADREREADVARSYLEEKGLLST
jgi:osmoprotectant transport system substrate-binding protein